MPGDKKFRILGKNALFSNLTAPNTFNIIPTKLSHYLLIATCILSLNHRGFQFNVARNKTYADFFKKRSKVKQKFPCEC